MTTCCCLMDYAAVPPSERRSTSKTYAATTAATYGRAPSRQAISSSGESSPEKASTSSHPCGKAPTGSHTSPGLGRCGSRRKTAIRSKIHGTSSTYASSTRDHVATGIFCLKREARVFTSQLHQAFPSRGPSPLRALYNASPRAARGLSHSMWNPMPRHGGTQSWPRQV